MTVLVTGTKRRWTEEEIIILKEGWITLSQENLQQRLGNRTWYSIQNKAKRLRLSGRRIYPYPSPFDRLVDVQISHDDCIRLATLLDTDGAIGMRNHRDKTQIVPFLSFSNTKEVLVQLFQEITQTKHKIQQRKRSKTWKQCYESEVSAMPLVYVILSQIKDQLIAKKRQAILIMEFIELQDERARSIFNRTQLRDYSIRQWEIYNEIKQLNKRGR